MYVVVHCLHVPNLGNLRSDLRRSARWSESTFSVQLLRDTRIQSGPLFGQHRLCFIHATDDLSANFATKAARFSFAYAKMWSRLSGCRAKCRRLHGSRWVPVARLQASWTIAVNIMGVWCRYIEGRCGLAVYIAFKVWLSIWLRLQHRFEPPLHGYTAPFWSI